MKLKNLTQKIIPLNVKALEKIKSFKAKNLESIKHNLAKSIGKKKDNLSTQAIHITKTVISIPNKLLEKAQDTLESSIDNEKEEVLLKQSPYWARSMTSILIGGTVFGIGWLGIAKTEEIVIAQGKLEPSSKVVDVQMPSGGVIEELKVKEGEIVEKGQVLMILDTDITSQRVKANEKILDINKQILDKLEILLKEGAISEIQYLDQITKISQIETELVEQKVNLKYQKITSPVRGIVFDLQPKGKGFVARSSEPVLQIVPLDDLQAKVEINSNKIGFVTVGKEADISIDSFPASDFGVIEGVVHTIGSDALPPDPSQGKGYRFNANIKLKDQILKLKNGKELPLQVGMSLTANIKLRKVTYLQLLLSSLSQKTDSLKEL